MTTNKVCKRCGGKGYGPWVVDFGRCFSCLGTGRQLPKTKTFNATVKRISDGREEDIVVVAKDDAEAFDQIFNSRDSMYSVGFEIVSIAEQGK